MDTPFDLAAWREQRTQALALSCGLTVTVKKIGLLDLAARGSIPTPLTGQVLTLLDEGSAMRKMDLQRFHEFVPVVDLVCLASIVAPPVAEVADETHIGIEEIPVLDRIEIFNWAQQEGAQLVAFPEQSAGGDHAAPDQPAVQPTPVGTAGHHK